MENHDSEYRIKFEIFNNERHRIYLVYYFSRRNYDESINRGISIENIENKKEDCFYPTKEEIDMLLDLISLGFPIKINELEFLCASPVNIIDDDDNGKIEN